MPVSIKIRNREVQNPVLRAILGGVLTVLAGIMLLFWFVVFALLVALSPVLILLHLGLRAFGRKGFVYYAPGKWSIKISVDGFRKASYRY